MLRSERRAGWAGAVRSVAGAGSVSWYSSPVVTRTIHWQHPTVLQVKPCLGLWYERRDILSHCYREWRESWRVSEPQCNLSSQLSLISKVINSSTSCFGGLYLHWVYINQNHSSDGKHFVRRKYKTWGLIWSFTEAQIMTIKATPESQNYLPLRECRVILFLLE